MKPDGYVKVYAPPSVAGLIEAMPISGDVWNPNHRELFIEAMRAVLSVIYKDRPPEQPASTP